MGISMDWARIDTRYLQNPKIRGVGQSGALLQLAGILYCTDELTDGFIPEGSIPVLAAWAMLRSATRTIQTLIASGLWEECEGGYQVHDFLEYQPSKEAALSKKVARAEAGRRGGLAKGQAIATANALAKSKHGTDTEEKKDSAAQSPKKRRRPSWDPPDWFAPLTELPGYRGGNHQIAADAIAAACTDLGVSAADVVVSFAGDWDRLRERYGKTDLVRFLSNNVHIQIEKVLAMGSRNGHEPPAPRPVFDLSTEEGVEGADEWERTHGAASSR